VAGAWAGAYEWAGVAAFEYVYVGDGVGLGFGLGPGLCLTTLAVARGFGADTRLGLAVPEGRAAAAWRAGGGVADDPVSSTATLAPAATTITAAAPIPAMIQRRRRPAPAGPGGLSLSSPEGSSSLTTDLASSPPTGLAQPFFFVG
jgi:hypothetical protein